MISFASYKRPFVACALALGLIVLDSKFCGLFAQESSEIDAQVFLNKDYSNLRKVLLKKGWKPSELDASRSQFQEISCGTRGDCVAFWSKPRGREAFISVDELHKPYKVIGIEYKQTVNSDNGGALIGSYCLGIFSNINAASGSGDVSGVELSVRGTEIDFVVAEGTLVGTKIKDFSVSGNKLRFTVWGKEFVGECAGKGVTRTNFNKVSQKIESTFIQRKNSSSVDFNIVRLEENTPDKEVAAGVPSHQGETTSKNAASRSSSKGPLQCLLRPNINTSNLPGLNPVQRLGTRIECSVVVDQLRIDGVKINRGNCSVSFRRGDYVFGNVALFFADCDSVLELSVETGFGPYVYGWYE